MTDLSAPIRLSADVREGEATMVGQVSLTIGGAPVAFELEVPQRPVTLQAMLPILQGITNIVVDRAEAHAIAGGGRISCQAGCGACCRKAAPVSESEARALAALVEAMPEPRRSEVSARFAAAEERFEDATLDGASQSTTGEVAVDFFGLGIACPFLENESCSIHPVRPLRCREYLVTSPAIFCANPKAGEVKQVPLPGGPSIALFSIDREQTPGGWLLLLQSLSWAQTAPPSEREAPPQDWLAAFVGRLTGQA